MLNGIFGGMALMTPSRHVGRIYPTYSAEWTSPTVISVHCPLTPIEVLRFRRMTCHPPHTVLSSRRVVTTML